MIPLQRTLLPALCAAALGAGAAPASASMMLGYQETGPGSVTGAGTVNVFSVPGSDFYGDSFAAPTGQITGAPAGFGFYDDFIFSIPTGAATNSITSTISLGNVLSITNLDVRLYSVTGNAVLPVLGTPAGGAIEATQTSISGGMVDMLSATLAPGTYVLEVRGMVAGSSGGSYSGTLNVSPVPLPEAPLLLLSGCALLGGLARRRAA
jgi:hypothetical protein